MRFAALPLALSVLLGLPACGDDAAPDAPMGGEAFDACVPFVAGTCREGLHCSFHGNNAEAACLPVGEVALGQACGGDERCASGVCMSLNGTDNRCYALCRDAADCGGETCLELSGAAFSVCRLEGVYPTCDLLAQDCDGELGCYAVSDEPEPICLVPGEVADGESCEFANSCLRGSACINGTCRTLCTPGEDDCDEGTACSAMNDGELGFCAAL